MELHIVAIPYAVTIRVNAFSQGPVCYRSMNIVQPSSEHTGIVHDTVRLIFPVIVRHPVLVGHAPPVVGGRVPMAHDAVESLVPARVELLVAVLVKVLPVCPLVGAVRQLAVIAHTVLGHQLLPLIDVHLALLVHVVSRHAPPGLHGDGGNGDVPAHAKPAVAPAAAIGQREVWLHSLPPCGDFDGIAQVSRAAVVGRGRLHQRQAL